MNSFVYVIKCVNSWDFDVFAFSRDAQGSPLKYLAYHLLSINGCLHKFRVPFRTIEKLLTQLEFGYTRCAAFIQYNACFFHAFFSSRNGNPYHNNVHAADVLQTTNWFLTQTGLKVWWYSPISKFEC